MALIRKTTLVRRHKDQSIHCEIELLEFPGKTDAYLVNVRQGRMGEEWRESSRTPHPVGLADAELLFQLALAERMAQGFADPAAPSSVAIAPPVAASRPPTPPAATLTDADRLLLQRLEKHSWTRLDQALRNRTLWRIGERRLHAAVPVLVELLERGDAMQDYCIAWAIGRCGDAGAAPAMRELHARGATDAIRRMALQAWLQLAGADARREHGDALIASWPAALRAAWDRQDAAAMIGAALDEAWPHALAKDAWLEQLDQAALGHPQLRPVLLAALRSLPLRPGVFRAARHIYKAAEMRRDADLFGVLHWRFETTPHAPERYVLVGRRYRVFAEEAARPDSTVAFGPHTRAYLIKRGWRTLRRLGQDDDPSFVPMALGALSAMDDSHAGQLRDGGRRVYDAYTHWPLFNHLLRARAGLRHSASGLTWYRERATTPAGGRTEAFPEIWDRHPDALLWLMQTSRCQGVHAFAARALIDNAAFCAALSQQLLRELLRSPYAATATFAFEVVRRRFASGLPDADWLLLLVQAVLPEAVQYALDCLVRAPERYAADALLVATVLRSRFEPARRQGWILCQAADDLPGQAEQIVLHLLDWLDHCEDDPDLADLPAIARDLAWALGKPLRQAAARATQARLLHLLRHRLAAVRLLACQWLLLHEVPAANLPGPALAALLRDPDVEVRGMGVRLFATLPEQMLAGQSELIAAFATHPEAALRRGIDPVLQRMVPADPVLADALLPTLLDSLFRAETGAGLHADLVGWLGGPLRQRPALQDPALLRRLLAARSKGAQLLGAALVERFEACQFEVVDWAAFGGNQNRRVRDWAYAAFAAHPARARARLEDALRLFDSKFDDTREFASGFFRDACARDDWTPLLLVSLCDHPDPAAQRFGRDMIVRHVDVADVADFMFKLSQHPSANMQLFVSAWLESASGGDLARLRRLEPYFIGALSQVNRGRVLKKRVQAFLRAQALLSEEIADFVGAIFARQVLTVAIADKAQYIQGLRDIQQRYPGLPAMLTIHAPSTLPAPKGTA